MLSVQDILTAEDCLVGTEGARIIYTVVTLTSHSRLLDWLSEGVVCVLYVNEVLVNCSYLMIVSLFPTHAHRRLKPSEL